MVDPRLAGDLAASGHRRRGRVRRGNNLASIAYPVDYSTLLLTSGYYALLTPDLTTGKRRCRHHQLRLGREHRWHALPDLLGRERQRSHLHLCGQDERGHGCLHVFLHAPDVHGRINGAVNKTPLTDYIASYATLPADFSVVAASGTSASA